MYYLNKLKTVSIVLAVLCLPLYAYGAQQAKYPFNIPDNVRIVQASPVDNVRTFSYISAALSSIAGASAENPFLIKVMPGSYTEVTISVPSFVTVEGSGIDVTRVTVTGEFNLLGGTVSKMSINTGEVHFSGNSTLKQTYVKANDSYMIGIDGTNNNIIDSVVEGTQNGIFLNSGDFNVTRSKLSANDQTLWLGGANMGDIVTIRIEDSEIRANITPIYVNIQQHIVNIKNSTIIGARVFDTNVYLNGYRNDLYLNIVGSQIMADYSVLRPGRDKMVNCYDGNYNAIPNLQ